MTSVAIRRLAAEDVPSVLALARTLHQWFNRQGLEEMEADLGVHQGFVAAGPEGLVGFATWNPIDARVVNLSWMGVAEARQHRGIGTALLAALAAELRRRGFDSVEVSTVADSVDYAPYVDTRRFYRGRGFVDYQVDPLFYGEGDDRYDRLRLRLNLRKPAGQ